MFHQRNKRFLCLLNLVDALILLQGVTIPSQIRYVNYYAKQVKSHFKYNPPSLCLKEVIMQPLYPNVNLGK